MFSRADVYLAGGDKNLVRRRCAAGSWASVDRDVFVLAGHPPSLDQRRWLGLAAVGYRAHLSHEAAAELCQFDSIIKGLVVATVSHPSHPKVDGATYHQLVDVRPAHLTVTRGFPTTTPARTIVDLASVVGPIRLGHAVEDGIVRRLMTFGDIAELLAEVRRRGKPGVARLVQVLDGIAGEPPPESELERLLWRATEMVGVRAARQRPLPSREPVANLVDVLVPASRLILEADGRRWHARQQAMSNDRRRDREAARLGWQTLRFMFEDLHGDLPGCAADIRQVHRRRTAAAAS